MRARDVTLDPSGNLAWLAIEAGTPIVFFDGIEQNPIELPEPVISGRIAVDGRGVRYGVAAANHSDVTYVFTDQGAIGSVPVGGRFFVALRGLPIGAEVYAQGRHDGHDGTIITVYDADTLLEKRRFPARYGSMGILAVTGPNSILSSADPSISDGQTFWNRFTDPISGWSVMQVADPDGLVAVSPTGARYRVMPTRDGYTNMPSYIAGGFVAVNDPDPTRPALGDPPDLPLTPIDVDTPPIETAREQTIELRQADGSIVAKIAIVAIAAGLVIVTTNKS